MALVVKGNKLMMRAVPGARFFVPETMYNQRRINFFKNTTFVAKCDVRLILGFDFDEKEIYILTNLNFFAKAPHHNTQKNQTSKKQGGKRMLSS